MVTLTGLPVNQRAQGLLLDFVAVDGATAADKAGLEIVVASDVAGGGGAALYRLLAGGLIACRCALLLGHRLPVNHLGFGAIAGAVACGRVLGLAALIVCNCTVVCRLALLHQDLLRDLATELGVVALRYTGCTRSSAGWNPVFLVGGTRRESQCADEQEDGLDFHKGSGVCCLLLEIL